MVDAYINYWKKYVDFKSRNTRSEFWWVVLVNYIISFVTLVFGFLGIFIGMDIDLADNPHITNIFAFVVGISLFIVYVLYNLATIIPNIMLSIRRIRDTGLSPWWYALKLIVLAGSGTYYYSEVMIGSVLPLHGTMIVSNGLSAIAGLALFIMYLLPSKETTEETTEESTEETDTPTQTPVNLDTTSDEKSPSKPSATEADVTQTDSKPQENAED